MLFTLMAVATASQAFSLRPVVSASARSAAFAKLSEVTTDSSLQAVAGVVNEIMLQQSNATMHLSDAEQEILRNVSEWIIPEKMYGSMDSAQIGDAGDLALAIDNINMCHMDLVHRLSHDISGLHGQAIGYQHDLNELQDDVDQKTIANATAWNNLANHMRLISPAPSCDGLPHPKTMESLDVYFDSSDYVNWYTSQQAAYWPVRDAYVEADRQLKVSLAAYQVGLAIRNLGYCDWKRELEWSCSRYHQCYEERKAHYLNVVKPGVEERMKMRIENYKAGETIIHQIKFLLAEVDDQTTPSISTTRYQMDFPDVPPRTECDMSALHDEMWVPTVDCREWVEIISGGFCGTGWITGNVGGTSAECQADCEADGQCGAYCFGTGNPEWDCLRYTSDCTGDTVHTVLHGHAMSAYSCYRFQ